MPARSPVASRRPNLHFGESSFISLVVLHFG